MRLVLDVKRGVPERIQDTRLILGADIISNLSMQKIALRKEGFLFGGKEKEVREPARPISACTILILCNSHKHASKKSKKKSPRTE